MAQLVRKTPFGNGKANLGKHERGVWDFSPSGGKYDKNVYLSATGKTPEELSKKIREQNDFYDTHVKTPLDDFKRFEDAVYMGFDPYEMRGRYGISPYDEKTGIKTNMPYQDIINAYGKSRGKFAAKANDPEIKKYFDEQMAYRNGI